MERSELRLECLKLAHSKVQPREDAAATIAKSESYFEFVTLQPSAKVTAQSAPRGGKKKNKR